MDSEASIPAWTSNLGIVDRASGIDAARNSRQQLFDAAGAALTAFHDAGGATVPNLLLLGLATRGLGLHNAAVHALETDNPFAALTLIRAYAENAATVLYALDRPDKIDQLYGFGDKPIAVSTITNHAMQSPSTRFGEFRAIYKSLSAHAHPMSKSILASSNTVGENGFQWSAEPAFKSDGDFLTACAWIVEFAIANADLLAEFAQYRGDDNEFVVLFR
jgi:hypothetical protein